MTDRGARAYHRAERLAAIQGAQTFAELDQCASLFLVAEIRSAFTDHEHLQALAEAILEAEDRLSQLPANDQPRARPVVNAEACPPLGRIQRATIRR